MRPLPPRTTIRRHHLLRTGHLHRIRRRGGGVVAALPAEGYGEHFDFATLVPGCYRLADATAQTADPALPAAMTATRDGDRGSIYHGARRL